MVDKQAIYAKAFWCDNYEELVLPADLVFNAGTPDAPEEQRRSNRAQREGARNATHSLEFAVL